MSKRKLVEVDLTANKKPYATKTIPLSEKQILAKEKELAKREAKIVKDAENKVIKEAKEAAKVEAKLAKAKAKEDEKAAKKAARAAAPKKPRTEKQIAAYEKMKQARIDKLGEKVSPTVVAPAVEKIVEPVVEKEEKKVEFKCGPGVSQPVEPTPVEEEEEEEEEEDFLPPVDISTISAPPANEGPYYGHDTNRYYNFPLGKNRVVIRRVR